jgi:hypothetical protein
MGLGKGDMERHSRKLYGGDLGVLRRCYNKCQIKLTHQHIVNQVDSGPGY